MKKAHTLKKASVIMGFLGILALIFAWRAEFSGFVFGFESRVWYNDAITFLLIAIWLKLGAIYHKGEGE
ncbi:MAG: hypothetical protein AAB975_04195 [Patescibacteria group bacterium]